MREMTVDQFFSECDQFDRRRVLDSKKDQKEEVDMTRRLSYGTSNHYSSNGYGRTKKSGTKRGNYDN